MEDGMKIVICTTPIRPVPTNYPPFGSMALIQSLRMAGYDPYFYDIDGLRPSFDEVVRFFADYQPDLIGVSAVVSTAYAYTKTLCCALRCALPRATIAVGGNLAASAELLLRRCAVDCCGVGEGERTIVRLAHAVQQGGGGVPRQALGQIKDLAFLDEAGEMVFTGYDTPIPVGDFLDPDYAILERCSRISNFITDPLIDRADFARDPRTYQPSRRGQKMATVVATKGCVARCTFCHRWDKGYRHLPPHRIIARMQELRDRYNVGFFHFGDENFGSDRRLLEGLIALIKPMDVLYVVAGVRCRSVDRELLLRMKESGCVAMYYGMETGSPRMLQVMEKNTTLEQNLQAAQWTFEAGIQTTYQLVLGMPGETAETIDETTAFVKQVTEPLPEPPTERLSINYIQALPGTPTYEYARQHGLLGTSLDDEEAYLLRISDTDAGDEMDMLNFTEEPFLTVQTWRVKMLLEAERHWYRVRGWKRPPATGPSGRHVEERNYRTQGGYFNLRRLFWHPWFYRYGAWLRAPFLFCYVLAKDLAQLPPRAVWRHLMEWLTAQRRTPRRAVPQYRSLGRIVGEQAPPPATLSERSMLPLRAGR